jgi:hypothetical protein
MTYPLKEKTMTGSFIGRFGFMFVILLTAFFAQGCATNKPFALVDEQYQFKPGTIAVLSGDNNEADNRFVDVLITELKEKSTLKVLDQEEIAKRVKNYPLVKPVVFGMGKDKNDKREKKFEVDRAKVDAIQGNLKTDYVFVLWHDRMTKWTSNQINCLTMSSSGYFVHVQGDLLEYPKKKMVGYTDFAEEQGESCCLLFKTEGEDIDDLIKAAAKRTASDLIALSKTGKRN